MKISFKNIKSILKPGFHNVKITSVTSLDSELPCFKVKFENDEGYLMQYFYISEKSKKFINSLFIASHIYTLDFPFERILGKEISILVVSTEFNIGNQSKMINKALWFGDVYYNHKYVNDDYHWGGAAEAADILGTSLEELARDMGKDPSEIDEGEVWEAMGY